MDMKKIGNRPGINKKLTNGQRMQLFRLACEKFIDQEKRDAFDAAVVALEDTMHRLVAKEQKKVAAISAYGVTHAVDQVYIPMKLFVSVERQLEAEGRTITRVGIETQSAAHNFSTGSTISDNWPHHRTVFRKKERHLTDSWGVHKISLKTPFETISTRHYAFYNGEANNHRAPVPSTDRFAPEKTISCRDESDTHPVFSHKDVRKAVYNASKCLIDLRNAEYDLHKAMFSVLDAAEKFSDVVDIWPEALELLDALYPTGVERAMSLVPADPAVKEVLCQNMKARGVVSPAMCAA